MAKPGSSRIDRFFGLSAHDTTMGIEVMAGATTFLAMAYIVFVNPQILGSAGMDAPAVFVATCLAAAAGSLVMGLWANYPIAQAPGMGLNAFFAFTVTGQMGIPWQVALAGTFVSGALFFLLAVTNVRQAIIDAIPLQMKLAVGAGIGAFIAFIGLRNAGLVVASPGTLVTLGDLGASGTLLAVFGLLVTVFLLLRRIRGAVFLGIVATTVAGIAAGAVDTPERIVSAVPSLAPTFGQALRHLPDLLTSQMAVVVFTMLFVDVFDTTGTLIAVGSQAGILTPEGQLPRARRALVSDAIATMAGAVLGTSTTTSYIESAAGVSAGGRTGLTAVVTAALFIAALAFSPLLAVVTPQATAPALIIVGVMMAGALGRIDWTALEVAIPAFITILAMPLTYSIANGIALGLLLFPVAMVFAGRRREVHPIMYGLALVFAAHFVWLPE
jgi:AGZA family xanthine/uracil permease-like MFS transporter